MSVEDSTNSNSIDGILLIILREPIATKENDLNLTSRYESSDEFSTVCRDVGKTSK